MELWTLLQGGLICHTNPVWNGFDSALEDRYEQFDRAMEATIADILFMLKKLDLVNSEKFENKVDVESLILMGHSFGGNAAHTLGFQKSQFKGIVDIDSKITERR